MAKNVIKTQVSRQYILNFEVKRRLLYVSHEGKHQNLARILSARGELVIHPFPDDLASPVNHG